MKRIDDEVPKKYVSGQCLTTQKNENYLELAHVL